MIIRVGIDPGVNGCIAVLEESFDPLVYPLKKLTKKDIFEILRDTSQSFTPHAYLEQVSSYGSGDRKMGAKSAFTFGRGVGHLEMALIAAEVPFDYVTPLKWQNAMKCRTGGDKNITKARAQELFPQIKITHAIADALLIAEYCRRTWK